MRKLAFLAVAFALVAVAFYGCDERSPTDPGQDLPQAAVSKVAKGHATMMSTEGVPMAYLGGKGIPRDANGRGQVVGWGADGSGGDAAILWERGVRTILPGLGGGYDHAYAINSRGQIVGFSRDADRCGYAVIWENRSIEKLSSLGGCYSFAEDINDRGQICGGSNFEGRYGSQAVIWDGGQIEDLGFGGGCFGINNRGHIVGQAVGVGAYLWADGQFVDLLPDVGWSSAYEINERGQVLIQAELELPPDLHALIWDSGTLQDLGSLFGDDVEPFSLNNRGQAVGMTYTPSYVNAPFLWENGEMRDLGVPDAECDAYAGAVGNDGTVYGSAWCPTAGYSGAVAWYP